VTEKAENPPELRHRVMAGFIGNVVEWYDFALYGYLAGVIAPVFFPSSDPTAGLIATYGIFAAGFMMRPLGAAVFGWFGDRYGRARTMQGCGCFIECRANHFDSGGTLPNGTEIERSPLRPFAAAGPKVRVADFSDFGRCGVNRQYRP